MPCFSHPDKLLRDHLLHVKEIGLQTFRNKQDLHLGLPPDDIEKALEIMLFYHDFGKATKYFQEYLNASINGKTYNGKSDLTHHALISAVYASYKVHREIENTESRMILSLIVFVAVRKHHGNLDDLNNLLVISKSEFRNLDEQWGAICFDEFEDVKKNNFEDVKKFADNLLFEADDIDKNINLYLLTNLFFSILTYSDKSEVILEKSAFLAFPADIGTVVDEFKSTTFKNSALSSLNNLRNEIYAVTEQEMIKKHSSGKIFSINLPTGSGKTLAVINTALKMLKEDNSLTKIVYALPFTSVIDQTAAILKKVFSVNNCDSDMLLTTHHHLAEVKTRIDEDCLEGDKAQFIIENWDKPFVLTTFWQLFYTLISSKNSQLRKYHNLANAIIILDEIQTMPHKYWKLWHDFISNFVINFNCRVILLTATMPLIFQEDKNEIIPLVPSEKRNRYFSIFSRYMIRVLNSLNDISYNDFHELAIKHIQTENLKSFLFVFNTINSSLNFYRKLKNSVPKERLVYLSTNILPIDRKNRINEIKENPAGKIIVSTQLIEAGVDIDLDIVYRDFAPLDSIVQTAGRCNRNNREEITGEVYLFKLKNERGQNDCNYIYQSITLDATASLFSEKSSISEHELLTFINSYYQKIKDRSSTKESCAIINYIKNLDYSSLDEFKMVEEIPSFLVFIEKDDIASNLLKQFENIMRLEYSFERKNEFMKIKSKFYQYVLSLKLKDNTKSTYTSFGEINNFRVIGKDFVDSLYKKDIGFSEEFDD